MPDALTRYAKPHANGDVRLTVSHHIGTEVPLKNGKPGRLGKYDIRRLQGREQSNRGRVRSLGPGATVEPVDFIAVCISQEWLCWICKEPMDVALHGTERDAISVEHDPAVSVCREHTLRTVKGAHQRCNHAKAAAEDTTRAAKIKRVQKDEEKHQARMALKTMTPAARRREKLKERIAKGNKAIPTRPFQPSMLPTRESRDGKTWQKGEHKYNWPKRKFPRSTRAKPARASQT